MGIFTRIRYPRLFKAILEVALSFALAFLILMSLRLALGVESPLYVVSSGSMVPTLNIGDIIVVQRVTPEQLSIGDIVVFRNPRAPHGAPIVHRIVDISIDEGGSYKITTVGDAVGVGRDIFSPWDASLLIGRVIMRVPYIGNIYLLMYSESPFAPGHKLVLVALIIIALIIILSLIAGDRGEKVSEKRVSWSLMRITYVIIVNLLLACLLYLSLWGRWAWGPGMFEEYRLNAERYGYENVALSVGFMTYRIDCLIQGGVRRGALTFSWSQFLLLILILFNVMEVLLPYVHTRLKGRPAGENE